MSRSLRLGLLLALVAIGVGAIVQFASGATAHRGSVSKKYGAKVTYAETNHGRTVSATEVGIQAHGAFSASLNPKAAIEAAIIAAATGIPATKIADGGTYTVQRNVAASGRITGTIVAAFKAKGLGTACASYYAQPGKFVPDDTFVPTSGKITTVGGTGAAARWRISVSFTQTGISGIKVEQFAARGTGSGAIGKARPLTKTCKTVAKLPKH